MSKADGVTNVAKELAKESDYMSFIPKVVALVQKTYKKTISSNDKKQMVINVVKTIMPETYTDDSIIEGLIDLTFYLARDVEIRKLLKKSCSCF